MWDSPLADFPNVELTSTWCNPLLEACGYVVDIASDRQVLQHGDLRDYLTTPVENLNDGRGAAIVRPVTNDAEDNLLTGPKPERDQFTSLPVTRVREAF